MGEIFRAGLPDWISSEVFRYLEHTVAQVPIRELARRDDCHPSTILRQIRRMEQLREDPLVDGALEALSIHHQSGPGKRRSALEKETPEQDDVARCLTLLSQPSAVLVAGRDMAKAVIVRDMGKEVQTSIINRQVAEMLALKDWIGCFASGQVFRYRITKEGRSALAEYLAATEAHRRQREESLTQSGLTGVVGQRSRQGSEGARRARYGPQDTPLQTLARLTDRDGSPFLTPEMISAGHRLREDFELAQIGQHVARERAVFDDPGGERSAQCYEGSAQASFQRASSALCALGPGLSDIALRCCCHLEGVEAAEKELGWSARSGKIVLRIALEQLHRYYASLPPKNQMIG